MIMSAANKMKTTIPPPLSPPPQKITRMISTTSNNSNSNSNIVNTKKIIFAFVGGILLGCSLMYGFNFNKSLYELDYLQSKLEINVAVLPTTSTSTSTSTTSTSSPHADAAAAAAKKKKKKDDDDDEKEVDHYEDDNGVVNNAIITGGVGGVRGGGGETATATATAKADTADTGTNHKIINNNDDGDNEGGKIMKIEIDDNVSTEEYNLHQIVNGRNFGYPKLAMKVLKQIWESDIVNPYNSSKDILVFEHPLKTGGTSLSDVLSKMTGGSGGDEYSINYNMSDGILPGSRRSGNFFYNEYPEQLKLKLAQQAANNNSSSVKRNDVEEDLWRNIKAVYSHSFINVAEKDVDSITGSSRLESFLTSNLPKTNKKKKFRVMTIVRDPFPFVASNMYEWMCAGGPKLNMAINLLDQDQNQNRTQILDEHGPCYGYSWSQLYNIWLNKIVKPYCNKTYDERKQIKRPPIKEDFNTINCHDIMNGTKLPSQNCQSIPIFLKSYKDGGMHDFSRRYVLPESYERHNNNHTNTNDDDDDDEGNKNNNNNSSSIVNDAVVVEEAIAKAKEATSDYEIDALQRLGGLTAQKDMYMMWIGITERMTESMCLFHSIVKYPYYTTPHARNKQCRPTSYFDTQNYQQLRSQEYLSYAVSNAAHAILDIRMIKLCTELSNKNNNDHDHLGLTVETCCSNFVFDNQGRIQNYTPSLIQ